MIAVLARGSVAALLVCGAAPGSAWAADRAEAVARTALRVCADPAAPPVSSEDGKGYENRIAELFGTDLGVPVRYTWFPNVMGFYRRTLNARRCDLVIGTVPGIEMAQTTIPYYRSSYVLVTRAADRIAAISLDDPGLQRLRLGVQAGSPAADLLARAGRLDTIQAYGLTVDSGAVPVGRRLIDDLAAKRIDAAVVWGPIGGHFASLTPGAFRVTPLTGGDRTAPLAFDIGMAVRYGEPKWRARVEQFIRDNRGPIREILVAANVPLLPLDEARP